MSLENPSPTAKNTASHREGNSLNKIKCENCEYMKCADVIYKSYYCMANEDNTIPLGVDYPPKRPPKSCPKSKERCESK